MSLNNVEVFNQYAYRTTVELVAQQIELFNAATNNAIVMRQAATIGDFKDETFWQLLNGATRFRDPRSNADIASVDLQMVLDTMVRVAAGTFPINIPPVMFEWIGMNPQEQGVKLARDMLAPLMMQQMLNTSVSALAAALSGQVSNVYDASAGAGGDELLNPENIVEGKGLLGDHSNKIAAWVLHSKPMHNYWKNAAQNPVQLYRYDTIAVVADPFGVPFVMSDIPALVIAGAPTDYLTLGLVAGAAVVERNDDFSQNIDTRNGGENIRRTYQAEWSYNLGLRGFAWDKTNGGAAPNAASIASSGNWDMNVASHKHLAGVVIRTQ